MNATRCLGGGTRSGAELSGDELVVAVAIEDGLLVVTVF